MPRPMTITEKLLARAARLEEASAGQFVNAKLDLVMANDITAPLAIDAFEQSGAKTVFDRSRVALVMSHACPAKDIQSAAQILRSRRFAREQNLDLWFEVGRGGVEHVLLPDEGYVVAGDVVLGADSHTCTYGAVGAFSTGVGSTDLGCAMALGETWLRVPETARFVYSGKRRPYVTGKDLILYTIGRIGVDGARYMAMEFTGETIRALPMADRLTMCNMAIEAGGKNGVVPPDEITREYEKERARREPAYLDSDPDATYAATYEWDVTDLEPQVAFPFLPSNAKPLSEAKGLEVDQVFIGSCTNGRLEDLRMAAEVFRGRKVHPRIRAVLLPGSDLVYRQAYDEGLFEVFLDAEVAIGPATCGPCLGGHMGVLAAGERCATTSNRNFRGRMGHIESEAYLVNPYIAAATAVAGAICGPDDLD